MGEPTIIPIVLFVCVFSVAIVAILAKAFTHIVCHWRDVSLKMRMVEAGYTAAEIERVIGARALDKGPAEFDVPPAKKPVLARN